MNVPPPALRPRRKFGPSALDLLREALIGTTARPFRSALTILGIVLGIASLVATIGLSETAGAQILGRLDELRASEITVTPRVPPTDDGPALLPWHPNAVMRLDGVRGAVALGKVNRAVLVSNVLTGTASATDDAASIDVVAASPGLLAAVRGRMSAGRFLDPVDERLDDAAVVLGAGAAARLHISRLEDEPAVFLDGHPYVVVGVLATVGRQPALLNSAIITPERANREFGLTQPSSVVMDVAPDAVRQLAEQAALALNPAAPGKLALTLPPDQSGLRAGVANDVNSLMIGLGLLALIVGGIGIANVMLVNVLERVFEIGLRRALGASRRAVATQVLIESAALGMIGGVVGSSLGVVTTVVTAVARGWIPVLEAAVPLLAPEIGALVGLLAGCYPAWRAAKLEPIIALRS